MKTRKRMVWMIGLLALTAAVFLAVQAGLASASGAISTAPAPPSMEIQTEQQTQAIETGADLDADVFHVEIRPPQLISIPYGFASPLPTLYFGREVIASGHGGCTDGEIATVVMTITQPLSGAIALGEDVHPCTGQYHTWSGVAETFTAEPMVNGEAEACGVATTRDTEGMVTDTYEWCVEVNIQELNEPFYTPIMLND